MPVKLIILDFAILTIFCEKYTLYGSSLFKIFLCYINKNNVQQQATDVYNY